MRPTRDRRPAGLRRPSAVPQPGGASAAADAGAVLEDLAGGSAAQIHFSSPRTEMRELVRTDRKTGKKRTVLQAPVWTGHADFIHPFDFIRFANETTSSQFDIMLEAKAKDLALLRL